MGGLRRIGLLVGLGARRVVGRLRIAPQRVLLGALGVALAVGLMVTVTGVSLGLASQSVVESDGVQYWIVPEQADVRSVAISSGGVQLGDVHDASRQITADPRVETATPVLLEIVPVRTGGGGEREYVLAVGVVPGADTTVLGMETADLTPGDPYYGNGSGGAWTGEAVINDAAATVAGATTGSTLAVDRGSENRTFTVTNVTTGDAATAVGTTPVAVVHLSELQALTGAATGDQADQILVDTDDPTVREWLAGLYPRTSVLTRGGLGPQQVTSTNLPLAIAIAALAAAVVVGVLFVTTLMGLEASADRRHLGTLAAVGFSRGSLSLVMACETVVVSLLGGAVGTLVGAVGVLAVNVFGQSLVGDTTVAVFDPILVGYAVVVALLIGILGAVYPVVVSRRADPLEVLSE